MTPIIEGTVGLLVVVGLIFWRPDTWRSFLDSLASRGGHIFVLILLIAWGSRMFVVDQTAGGQIITLAFGGLLTLLTGKKDNAGTETVTTTSPAPDTPTPAPVPPAPVEKP